MLEVFYMYDGKQQQEYSDSGILKIWENVLIYALLYGVLSH